LATDKKDVRICGCRNGQHCNLAVIYTLNHFLLPNPNSNPSGDEWSLLGAIGIHLTLTLNPNPNPTPNPNPNPNPKPNPIGSYTVYM